LIRFNRLGNLDPKSGNLSHLPINKLLRINTIRSGDMGNRLALTGLRFSRLVVTKFSGKDVRNNSYWDCVCDCGKLTRVRGSELKRGVIQSCGCLGRDRTREVQTAHSHCINGRETKIYRIWDCMKQRCNNPNNASYKNYGGRGIKVCDRWLKSFENFYADVGDCPPGMSLERTDNNGDYTPDNHRWATWEEQGNNRRDNVWISFNGDAKTMAQWARYLGMRLQTLRWRLNNWSVESAFTTPVRRRR
jgi:hypothetical protein